MVVPFRFRVACHVYLWIQNLCFRFPVPQPALGSVCQEAVVAGSFQINNITFQGENVVLSPRPQTSGTGLLGMLQATTRLFSGVSGH